MHAFVTLLTTAALLLHVLLGCCAHHAHARDVVNDDSRGKIECCKHHHGKCHSETEAGRHSKTPNEFPLGDCDESDCVFITGNATSFDTTAFVASIAVIDSHFVDFTASPASNFQFPAAPSLLAPQLRAHLLHQVFLI